MSVGASAAIALFRVRLCVGMSYQTGFNGKVGLVLGPALAKKKIQQLAPVRKAPSGVAGLFGGTGAADEADASQSAPQAVNLEVLRHQAQAAKMAAAATEVVDESVYDYDSFVDQEEERKRARAAAAAAVAAAQPQRGGPQRKESRYIGSLLKQAEERELERERIYERKLVKERKKEDELFGDKPLFVTEGYKRKLEEQRKVRYLLVLQSSALDRLLGCRLFG
jgi:coiled-coil domain-containing protein 55